MRSTRRAFTLIELLAVIAIIALLISILLPALAQARCAGKTSRGCSNLKQMNTATHSYTADFQDRIFSFSWRANSTNGINTSEPEAAGLANQATDSLAACAQMTYIVRKRGDRLVSQTPVPQMVFPYMTYSHTVLQDYLTQSLPDPMVINPEDRDRLQWSKDPRGYDQGLYNPNFGIGGENWRHPYGASYCVCPASVDGNVRGERVSASTTFGVFIPNSPGGRMGNRKLADVAAPANKVHMFDRLGRHCGKPLIPGDHVQYGTSKGYYAFFDGSVTAKKNIDGNPGADPNTGVEYTSSTGPAYSPTPIEPPAGNPGPPPSEGRVVWTRGGLHGNDFGGSNIRPGSAY